MRLACALTLTSLSTALTLAITTDDCPPNLPRDRFLRAHGNHCYRFMISYAREFSVAQRDCQSANGQLAIVRDADTQNFLYLTLRNELHFGGQVFIGYTDEQSEDHWVWVDGGG
jgi:hypothetical protein